MKANHNYKKELISIVTVVQISVIQRMKANHNLSCIAITIVVVVLNISNSKNESKSQLIWFVMPMLYCCAKYQ